MKRPIYLLLNIASTFVEERVTNQIHKQNLWIEYVEQTKSSQIQLDPGSSAASLQNTGAIDSATW